MYSKDCMIKRPWQVAGKLGNEESNSSFQVTLARMIDGVVTKFEVATISGDASVVREARGQAWSRREKGRGAKEFD